MFRSKSSTESQSQQSWAMQVLTPDYLIEGNVQPSGDLACILEFIGNNRTGMGMPVLLFPIMSIARRLGTV